MSGGIWSTYSHVKDVMWIEQVEASAFTCSLSSASLCIPNPYVANASTRFRQSLQAWRRFVAPGIPLALYKHLKY